MAASPKQASEKADSYSAQDIEVLEGLEPVRRRPAMYIGGSDERAMHHLAAELLDNSMDEAVAGHANWIEFELASEGTVTIRDNGARYSGRLSPKIQRQVGSGSRYDDPAFGRKI